MLSQPRANFLIFCCYGFARPRGLGFGTPRGRANLQQEKKTFFYSDGFWLNKYVCIKKCNLILCFQIFAYTWGCIKSKRGVPETLKIWKLSLDFKVSGPPLFLIHAEHLLIFLFPEPTTKKTKESNCWNIHDIRTQEHQKKTFKFKTGCHANWFTLIYEYQFQTHKFTVNHCKIVKH